MKQKIDYKPGIYCLENIVTGDMYIGQSNKIALRKSQHFSSLRKNEHKNKHLQRAYNKYGYDAFTFNVLLYCEKFELTRYEQELVNRLHPKYNILTLCVDSSRGIKRSNETRRRIGLASRGRKMSEENKKKLSERMLGKHPSDETLLKLRASAHKKERHYLWGKHHSDETRRKLSLARQGRTPCLGKHPSKETKDKISKASKNKYFSPETREKISIAIKKHWIIRKQRMNEND